MKVVTAKLAGSEVLSFKLPESLKEVPLKNYVAFAKAAGKIGDEESNQILAVAQAVGEFFGVDFEDILRVKIGGKNFDDVEGLDASLFNLYGYCHKLVSEWKPTLVSESECEFWVNGSQYKIPVILAQQLAGELRLPNIETIEAIEAAEVQRLTDAAVKAGKDEGGNLTYEMYLRVIAILCRKNGERLPIRDSERDQYILGRIVELQEIDTCTALNVDFFLKSTLRRLGVVQNTFGFLLHRAFVQVAEILLKSERNTTGSRRKMRKFSGASVGVE